MAILLGLFFVGFGFFGIWRSIRLRSKGLFTIGTITEVKMRRGIYNVFVSFKTTRKRTVVFRAGGWTSINISPFYQIGNSVPVLYDPTNPTNAAIYTFDFMWLLPLAFIGLGFFIIYQTLTR